jgi:hypothetical protein
MVYLSKNSELLAFFNAQYLDGNENLLERDAQAYSLNNLRAHARNLSIIFLINKRSCLQKRWLLLL